ncbi:MAG: SpoIIE family protein phosphatase [Phycisphaerales bacterium]
MLESAGDEGIDRGSFEQILMVARRLASSSDLAEVLGLIIDALRDTLCAERASVFQYDSETHELFATKAHGLPSDLRLPADLGIIGEAARSRKTINITSAYEDTRFNPAVDKATGFRTRCILTLPLVDHNGSLVGVAQVLNKVQEQGGLFTEDDETLAQYLADQAAVALKRAALLDGERRKEKMEADLAVAKRIQMSALPSSLPKLEGYDIAGISEPADETGGDAYDVIDIRPFSHKAPAAEGDALIFMADATGHGIGPAISVTQVLAMIRMSCRLGAPLRTLAEEVNRQVCADLPLGRFVTAFIGELDTRRHQICYISAGQAPLLFIRANPSEHEDIVDTLPAAMPMGIDTDFLIEGSSTVALHPGDVFVVLSDGYYEAMDPDDTLLGLEPIVEAVRNAMHGSAQQIIDALRHLVEEHARGRPAGDDMTAVIIKRKPG